MSEGHPNLEVAHVLHERGHRHRGDSGKRMEILEVLEGVTLAIVAVATAWSSYQAAKWDGRSAESYAEATAYSVEADEAATLGGQHQLQDLGTFNAWLLAKTMNHDANAELLERRFSPEYRLAFRAWLETNPFQNDSAPPGPRYMPQYKNPFEDSAKRLKRKAFEAFDAGKSYRNTGENYVRAAVLLATVLFLVAVAQRFRVFRIRMFLLCISLVLMSMALYHITTYPRT